MKIPVVGLILATSAGLWTGCVNPDGTQNNTGSGALMGGVFGALAGSALGGRHGGDAALLGAASGVVAGALIGNAVDQHQDARWRGDYPPAYAQFSQQQPLSTLSINDIKALARAGITEDTIISQIITTHSGFRLSSTDIIALRDAGASDKVIHFMISTASDPEAVVSGVPTVTVVVDDRPPAPLVEAIPATPPAPGYVWIGGDWVWNDRWVWVDGHWAKPPHPHSVWITGDWVKGPHGWYRTEGYWK